MIRAEVLHVINVFRQITHHQIKWTLNNAETDPFLSIEFHNANMTRLQAEALIAQVQAKGVEEEGNSKAYSINEIMSPGHIHGHINKFCIHVKLHDIKLSNKGIKRASVGSPASTKNETNSLNNKKSASPSSSPSLNNKKSASPSSSPSLATKKLSPLTPIHKPQSSPQHASPPLSARQISARQTHITANNLELEKKAQIETGNITHTLSATGISANIPISASAKSRSNSEENLSSAISTNSLSSLSLSSSPFSSLSASRTLGLSSESLIHLAPNNPLTPSPLNATPVNATPANLTTINLTPTNVNPTNVINLSSNGNITGLNTNNSPQIVLVINTEPNRQMAQTINKEEVLTLSQDSKHALEQYHIRIAALEDKLKQFEGKEKQIQEMLKTQQHREVKEHEEMYIFSKPKLKEFYVTFQMCFNDAFLAISVIHSEMVANATSTKSDKFAYILSLVGQHIPVAGSILEIISSIIQGFSQHEKKEAINRAAAYIVGASTIQDLGEVLARRLTLAQEPQIESLIIAPTHVSLGKKLASKAKALGNKVLANDINDVIKEMADDQCKIILATIMAGHLAPHPNPHKSADVKPILEVVLGKNLVKHAKHHKLPTPTNNHNGNHASMPGTQAKTKTSTGVPKTDSKTREEEYQKKLHRLEEETEKCIQLQHKMQEALRKFDDICHPSPVSMGDQELVAFSPMHLGSGTGPFESEMVIMTQRVQRLEQGQLVLEQTILGGTALSNAQNRDSTTVADTLESDLTRKLLFSKSSN